MPIDPVSSNYFGLTNPAPKENLSMQMFMRLLTVQLANQNPLEPMNDRDFFAQMAQLGTVEGLDRMGKSLDVSQAAGLIGKTVSAVSPMTENSSFSNELVRGKVVGLNVRNGENHIVIKQDNGSRVEVKVKAIRSVEQ